MRDLRHQWPMAVRYGMGQSPCVKSYGRSMTKIFDHLISLKQIFSNKSFSFALLQILFAVCDWKCRFGIFWNCLADFAILICMIGGISNFLANDYPELKKFNWLTSFERVFQLELAAVIFAGIDRGNFNRFFYFNCKI